MFVGAYGKRFKFEKFSRKHYKNSTALSEKKVNETSFLWNHKRHYILQIFSVKIYISIYKIQYTFILSNSLIYLKVYIYIQFQKHFKIACTLIRFYFALRRFSLTLNTVFNLLQVLLSYHSNIAMMKKYPLEMG